MNSQIKKLITAHYSLFTASKGFTLIELAIVLVIVGMLVGMGAGLMGPLTKRAKIYETKEIINAATEELTSYGATNNDLPDITAFSSEIKKSTDVWGRALSYIMDDRLKDSALGGICERKSTYLTVRTCSNAACTSYDDRSNIAFIILSGGENTNNQTRGSGAVTTSTNVNVYANGLSVDNYPTDISRVEAYDDIVKWISLNELRIKAGCSGPQIKILNNELPVATKDSAYSADIYADGGVPFSGGNYKWCREENIVSGLTFSPSTLSGNCSGLSESGWGSATKLTISDMPTISGTVMFTFFVRDNNDTSGANDNIAQKTIVLTIN